VSGRVDRKAALITALLLLIGLVILYSASAPFSLKHYGSDTYMLFKQFLAAIAGIALLLFFSWFDYHRLAAINDVLFLGAIGFDAPHEYFRSASAKADGSGSGRSPSSQRSCSNLH